MQINKNYSKYSTIGSPVKTTKPKSEIGNYTQILAELDKVTTKLLLLL